jgi:CHAT domain-containing protein
VSSYTPSLHALLRARAHAKDVPVEGLSALLVGVPDAPNMPRLSKISEELAAVTKSLAHVGIEPQRLEGAQATRTAVMRELFHASIVHLSCHGVQDPIEPLNSGFCLSDEKLTITALMDIHLPRAFLAFLSACETAKGDQLQTDEAIHLSSALLFCGYPSVIATRWCGEWYTAVRYRR